METAVERQLDAMLRLNDRKAPNFIPSRGERGMIAEPLGLVLEATGYLADGERAVSFRRRRSAG